MRRKSKKVKEDARTESSSERRSKRSCARRKKTYDDEEGGSGVEEDRTTEDETNITKARERGNRRYATRGRRQKAEESEEEEASPNEEERVEFDEESNNNIPVVTEVEDQVADSDDSKEIQSTSAVADKAISSNDEPSSCTADGQIWEMKAAKNLEEDKPDALPVKTPAPGEGDDGEEEVSRSHSRKKKLKLSRECLHESREAIPKIRLRLSRNRSGGYETEKLEAERIEEKAVALEPVVEVLPVKSEVEEPEEKPEESSEPAELIESEVVKPDSTEVEGAAEVVEVNEDRREEDKEEEETVQAEEETQPEEETVQAEEVVESSAEVSPEVTTVDEEKMEVSPQVEEAAPVSPVVEPEAKEEESTPETAEESPTEAVQPTDNQETEESPVEMVEETPTGEVEEEKSEEQSTKSEDAEVVEEMKSSPPSSEKEEAVAEEEKTEHEELSENEVPRPTEEERDSEEDTNQVSMTGETEVDDKEGDVKEEIKDVAEPNVEVRVDKSQDGDSEEKEVVRSDHSELAKEDDNVVAQEDDNVEAQEDDNVEAQEDENVEAQEDENVVAQEDENVVAQEDENVVAQEDENVVAQEEENAVVSEGSISKEAENIVPKDREEGESESCDEKQIKAEVVTGEESGELHSSEEGSHKKSSSGERVSKLNRSTLRRESEKEEDDPTQKRRGRTRRSHSHEEEGSSGNGEVRKHPVVMVPQEPLPQPKRVTLKRPKLNRAVSSVSVKSIEAEEKEELAKVEGEEKMEEGDKAPDAPVDHEEESKEEVTPEEQKSSGDDVMKRRRRKWSRTKSEGGPSQSKRPFMSISSQSLKGLIPEVKPLPIHELRLSIEKEDVQDICMDEEESCEALGDETIVRMIDANGQNERTVWAQVVDDEMRPSILPEAPRVPATGGSDMAVSGGPVRRISIVSDDATRLQRSPSPPRHPPSNVLFLSNLVRPFTVQQLKELLARTGTVVKDGFWIDKIKSMCLVEYETEEQARETRHALHGVRWPISNPKRLWVDFSTKERLEESKKEGSSPPLPQTPGPSHTPPHPSRDEFPRKTEPLRVDGSGMVPMHPSHRGAPGSPGRQGHGMVLQPGQMITGGQAGEGVSSDVSWQQRGRPRPEPPPLRPGANARDFKMSVPVREWDLDKVVQQSPPRQGIHGPLHPSAMDERRRPDIAGQPGGHRDRVMPSPPPNLQEMQARKTKRKDVEAASAEAPANLLDSLFRKTKATPSIYWLPLTADQIKVKEEIRRQHLAEHERRMTEMKRAAAKERAGRRRRRSSSPRRRSRRRSGEDSGPNRKRPSESMKGRKAGSISPKK